MATRILTQTQLKEMLRYDPDKGTFTWLVPRTAGVQAGDLAGSHDVEGYLLVTVFKRCYRGHRLAWFYMTGEWPSSHIDHINRNPADNRFANLRLATAAQNGMNRKLDKRNASGVTGVTWCKTSKKWRVDIEDQGKSFYLGRFDDLDKAISVRKSAEASHSAVAYIQR